MIDDEDDDERNPDTDNADATPTEENAATVRADEASVIFMMIYLFFLLISLYLLIETAGLSPAPVICALLFNTFTAVFNADM